MFQEKSSFAYELGKTPDKVKLKLVFSIDSIKLPLFSFQGTGVLALSPH